MPSRSKIQYLIHLDDCRRRAIEDLTHSLRLSEKTSKAVRSTDSCCKDQDDQDRAETRIAGIQNDANFLIDRLVSLEKPITAVRLQILEQMNLAQGQRALILTIAAALFIPLSFVSVSPIMIVFQYHASICRRKFLSLMIRSTKCLRREYSE